MKEATQHYVADVLRRLPDERMSAVDETFGQLANPFDPSQGFVDDETEPPYDPWEAEAEAVDESAAARFDINALRAQRLG